MTSYDRHASHDSPYRTGQHVPLAQSRHAPLTSVATTAFESRADLESTYNDNNGPQSAVPLNGDGANGWPGKSPNSPYSPGMRSSTMLGKQSADGNSFDSVNPGEIQMQSFQDGLPPPPPVAHSWKRIERWTEDNYTELFDQLSEGCTQNDVNELEHQLDVSLPMEVRETLQIHDGQERGGLPTGIIFGCMLLDCEEIVQEWQNWRTVNEEYLSRATYQQPQTPLKAFGGASSSSSSAPQQAPATLWRQELLDKQDSQPPRAVQKAYAHPAWIPLARDWGGNNLAVDLAPGPAGKWGQVIIFGRDYDCKYVVARSWSAFLATVADDMTSEKVFVDEETGELKLKEFKSDNVEPAYLDILRWRMDQKYGRKGPRRKAPANANSNGHRKSSGGSPYGSPTAGDEERGRSPQRFPSGNASNSPRGPFGKSSPLARVAEEMPAPLTVHTGGDAFKNGSISGTTAVGSAVGSEKSGKLVEVGTPRVSDEEKRLGASDRAGSDGAPDQKQNGDAKGVTGLGVEGVSGISGAKGVDGTDEMKEVEI
ncbi:MAG: hypothetical protein M1819_004285 [Sarea resinae]|nr:MAG: hypothetical protein M1819_004285 [Sarea resinae]